MPNRLVIRVGGLWAVETSTDLNCFLHEEEAIQKMHQLNGDEKQAAYWLEIVYEKRMLRHAVAEIEHERRTAKI